ncbi:MAG: asparagine synthase (glutamine-hydrolyzing) [Magnetococcus sp. WYHC-3]
MCGIAGLIAPGRPVAALQPLLTRALQAIAHRGPDDAGQEVAPGVALGMRRLSIIDRAGGHQPMVDAATGVTLVYNGEIYNHDILRQELMHLGRVFRTRSDTEVLLQGYLQWGQGVLDRLEGMFAFALLDPQRRQVVLARDRFGVKPLYHVVTPGLLAFCSEPDPLLDLLPGGAHLDPVGLASFLACKYVPAPGTLVRGLGKLPPATVMVVPLADPERFISRVYWTFRPTPWDGADSAAACGRCTQLLQAAVQRQLVSDVPVGAFLSGGIDSGLLLWATRGLTAAGQPVSAHTVGFAEADYDESALAAATARHLGVTWHLQRLSSPEAAQLDHVVARYGEPFANLSVPASLLVCQAAASQVKVALNGSGADELFGGYDRYLAVQPPLLLRSLGWAARVLGPLLDALPAGSAKRGLVRRGRVFLRGLGQPPGHRHADAVRLMTDAALAALAPGLPAVVDRVVAGFAAAPVADDLARAGWADVTTMMADDYLTLVDRTSMAVSLEVRVPFLDTELAQFALGLPPSMKIHGWRKKWLLRELARQHLPRAVARAPKQGFEAPVAAWFRGTLGQTLLSRLADAPLGAVLDRAVVSDLVQGHRHGRINAARELLALYTLVTWAERRGIRV